MSPNELRELERGVGLLRQGFAKEALRVLEKLVAGAAPGVGMTKVEPNLKVASGATNNPGHKIALQDEGRLPDFRLIYNGDRIVAVEIDDEGWVIPQDVRDKAEECLKRALRSEGNVFVKEWQAKAQLERLLKDAKDRRQIWRTDG